MAGKWFGLITVFIIVMVGLTASAAFLNWLTTTFFGSGRPAQQQQQVSETELRQQRGEELRKRKELQQEKHKEQVEKNRHEREVAAKIAKDSAPAPLSEAQYSTKTGQVVWPKSLQSRVFEKPRSKLDQLLKERAESPDRQHSSSIQSSIDQMQTILKENIQELPAADYIAARKFLESLGHMLRQ
ncbi:MAG: hypothetical protein JSS02_12870 [Planctomycetes bacterium]|nr:hypothetical protein [Planctomycetota bacterium]